MHFRATVLLNGKTATGVVVPDEIVTSLGGGKHPPVRATINGYTYRSSIASMGGKFMLGISSEHRTGSGVAAGDEIDIDVELDNKPREVTVPPDFVEALELDAEAKRFFDKLAYSHKLRHVLAIEQAKTPETRQRRIEKAITMLHEGKS